MSASVDDTFKASRPFANGSRMPSIAEEVFAEIQSRASALAGDRKNRFDFASFINRILRLVVVRGLQSNFVAIGAISGQSPHPNPPPKMEEGINSRARVHVPVE